MITRFLLIVLLSAGCSPKPTDADLSIDRTPTSAKVWLKQHAKPTKEQRPTISVVTIQDKTGSLDLPGGSRSVTQGSTEILKHMLNSDPYRLYIVQQDRQNLEALLRERTLADRYNAGLVDPSSSSRLNSLMSPALPKKIELKSLKPIQFFISGAVIGYDKSVSSSTDGISVNVARKTEQTSIDEVQVTLFLTDTDSGEIVSSYTSRQRVGSVKTSAGFFGFPSRDMLLEIESGGARNASVTDAVIVAMEKCLSFLIMQMHREHS